jgi:hypothetical protein
VPRRERRRRAGSICLRASVLPPVTGPDDEIVDNLSPPAAPCEGST